MMGKRTWVWICRAEAMRVMVSIWGSEASLGFSVFDDGEVGHFHVDD